MAVISLVSGTLVPMLIGTILDRFNDKCETILGNIFKRIKIKFMKKLAKYLEKTKLAKLIDPIKTISKEIREFFKEEVPEKADQINSELMSAFKDFISSIEKCLKGKTEDLKVLFDYKIEKLEERFNEVRIDISEEIEEIKNSVQENINGLRKILLEHVLTELKAATDTVVNKIDEHDIKVNEKLDYLRHDIQKIMKIITNKVHFSMYLKDIAPKESLYLLDEDFTNGERDITLQYRRKMVNYIKNKPEHKKIIKEWVTEAMLTIPRHLFINYEVMRQNGFKDEDIIAYAYNPQRPMPAAGVQNSSSPEVIAMMLSLLPLKIGGKILFIGAKGGYIQALCAVAVGKKGLICTVSSDEEALKINQIRCERYLKKYSDIMEWEYVDDPLDLETAEYLYEEYGKFDNIFVCGQIYEPPLHFFYLLDDPGYITAPIGDENLQYFTIYELKDNAITIYKLQDFRFKFGKPI